MTAPGNTAPFPFSVNIAASENRNVPIEINIAASENKPFPFRAIE